MPQRCITFCLAIALLTTTAAADTKIVQESHQDAFTVMGQSQPASDVVRTVWLAADRMRVDDGTSTLIVRLDSSILYVIDHNARTVSSVVIPIDVAALLPQGMAEQLRAMMQLTIDVVPTDETKKVGAWSARRWNMTMTSPMVTVESALWATKDLDIDRDAYDRLSSQIIALRPGMEELVEKLRAVAGFVVETQTVTRLGGATDGGMKRNERTVSVETAAAPAGTYDPPSGYDQRPFDLLAALQQQ
jgi:hypothetical protein